MSLFALQSYQRVFVIGLEDMSSDFMGRACFCLWEIKRDAISMHV